LAGTGAGAVATTGGSTASGMAVAGAGAIGSGACTGAGNGAGAGAGATGAASAIADDGRSGAGALAQAINPPKARAPAAARNRFMVFPLDRTASAPRLPGIRPDDHAYGYGSASDATCTDFFPGRHQSRC
jgi:hypothetical protein